MIARMLPLPPPRKPAGTHRGPPGLVVVHRPAPRRPTPPPGPAMTVRTRLLHYVATTDDLGMLDAILLFVEGEQGGAP